MIPAISNLPVPIVRVETSLAAEANEASRAGKPGSRRLHIVIKNLARCATGLLCAVSLRAAELPAPLASAISRLRNADAYAWTTDFKTPGAPFTLAPVKGWAKADGESLMEVTVEGIAIQAVTVKTQRIVRFDAEQGTPSKVDPQKESQVVATARLLRTPLPADELSTLLNYATAIHADADGTFSAVLGADVAAEIASWPMKDLPQRGFSPKIKGATASVRFWVKDGALQRYVISSTAKISLPLGSREINHTITVELHEIDTAEATLPAATLSEQQSMGKPSL